MVFCYFLPLIFLFVFFRLISYHLCLFYICRSCRKMKRGSGRTWRKTSSTHKSFKTRELPIDSDFYANATRIRCEFQRRRNQTDGGRQWWLKKMITEMQWLELKIYSPRSASRKSWLMVALYCHIGFKCCSHIMSADKKRRSAMVM